MSKPGSEGRQIGTILRQLRKDRRWTLGRTADAADVTSSWLSLVERGLRQPGSDRLARLAKVLDVSLDRLLTGDPILATDQPNRHTDPDHHTADLRTGPGSGDDSNHHSDPNSGKPGAHHQDVEFGRDRPSGIDGSSAQKKSGIKDRQNPGGFDGSVAQKNDRVAEPHGSGSSADRPAQLGDPRTTTTTTTTTPLRPAICILPDLLEQIGRMDLDHQRWLLKILKYK